jgi:hypothetical protein
MTAYVACKRRRKSLDLIDAHSDSSPLDIVATRVDR